jgi:hypothetical protein
LRSIDQLLVNGGGIGLNANEVDAAPGAILNLMGGYVHYLSGIENTTRLIGSDGHIYSVGSADPNITYVGIAGQFTVDHPRWGVTQTFASGLLDGGTTVPDYIQGGNAGALGIVIAGTNGVTSATIAGSGALVFDSTVMAEAFAGTRQVQSGNLPSGGSFSATGIEPIEIGDPTTLPPTALATLSLPAGFSMASPLLASAGSAYAATNVIDPALLDGAGLSAISLSTGVTTGASPLQPITEDAGATLSVQPRGSIALLGDTATINGTFSARGGSISITTKPNTGTSAVPGDITIASGAVLDVSGFSINDSLLPVAAQAPALPINAGSISLSPMSASARPATRRPRRQAISAATLPSLQEACSILRAAGMCYAMARCRRRAMARRLAAAAISRSRPMPG